MPLGDGRQGWAIQCDGLAVSIAMCYRRAADVCPNGFTPVDQSERTAGGALIPNGAGGATVLPMVGRTLIVACNT
jgi:hypothetical protein